MGSKGNATIAFEEDQCNVVYTEKSGAIKIIPIFSTHQTQREFLLGLLLDSGVAADAKGNKVCTLCDSHLTLRNNNRYSGILDHMTDLHGVSYENYERVVADYRRSKNPAAASQRQTTIPECFQPTRAQLEGTALWFCDHSIPLSAANDATFRRNWMSGNNINSKALRVTIVGMWSDMEKANVDASANTYCTVCADLGTTQSMHTLAMTVVSRTDKITHVFAAGCTAVVESKAATLHPLIDRLVARLRAARAIVTCIVTDNGRNVAAAARMNLTTEEVRCFIHSSQLYINDTVMKSSVVALADAELKKESKTRYLACPTRWWSLLACLERLLRDLYRAQASAALIGKIKAAVDLLQQYRVLGRIMERDDCSILGGMELFFQMGSLAGGNQKEFRKRVCLMLTNTLVAAAALQPGALSGVTGIQLATIKNVVVSVAQHMIPGSEKNAIFNEITSVITGQFTPESGVAFWDDTSIRCSLPILGNVMQLLKYSCCSEASTERYFSRQGLVHTALRASMSEDLVMASAGLKCRNKRTREDLEREVRESAIEAAIKEQRISEIAIIDADAEAENDKEPEKAPEPEVQGVIPGLSVKAAKFYISMFFEKK